MVDYKDELRGLLKEIMSEKTLEKANEVAALKAEEVAKVLEANAELKARIEAIEKMPAVKVALNVPGEVSKVNFMYKGYDLRTQAQNLTLTDDRKQEVAKFFIDMIHGKAALAEGAGSTGGYLVPEEFSRELLAFARLQSVTLKDCRVVNMGSDTLRIPAEDTSVTVLWKGEGVELGESEPTVAEVVLTADRLGAWAKASNEFLADSTNDVVSWLTELFAEAIGQEIDDCVFNAGSGLTTFSGILSAANTESVSMAATGTSPSRHVQLTHSELSEAISKLSSNKIAGAKWYVHRNSMHGVRTMVDAGSHLIWSPPYASTPAQIYDYPYELVEKLPAAPAAGAGFAVFGNLKRSYVIGRRNGNMTIFVDPFTLSTYDQTRFKVSTRWAGRVVLPSGLVVLKTHA